MKVIKNDWLTIPDAPLYEINSQLLCRNKKTKRLLTLHRDSLNHCSYYSLYSPKSKYVLRRSPQSFRSLAKAAIANDTFEPIQSLNGKYEINERGKVRNSKSKKIIKSVYGNQIRARIGGKVVKLNVKSLLWEVFGQEPSHLRQPCPCSAENAHSKHFFKNIKACAQFLAPKLHYSGSWIRTLLYRRVSKIFGWSVTYLDSDPRFNDFALANKPIHHISGEKEKS